MFFVLLAVTLAVSIALSALVVLVFDGPVGAICRHVIGEQLSSAWQRYLRFAIFVTGVSSGVSIWTLEQYVTPRSNDAAVVALNAQRWTFEVYRCAITTLQGTACALFTFFLLALIAHVLLKRGERTQSATRADA